MDSRGHLSGSSWTPRDVSKFGMALFIAAEAMFFAGLISAYLVFRAGAAEWPPAMDGQVPNATGTAPQGIWPPAGQPRLPVERTVFNTIALFASAYFMHLSVRAFRAGHSKDLSYRLGLTAVCGALFLVLQGAEWIRLVQFGLTLTSSIYGGLFYTLIGIHALHVLGGLAGVFYVLVRSVNQRLSGGASSCVHLCRMYWNFVVGLWPILYVLVYLL